ncbi:MAG: monovalent cation/H+ antiporter subunit D [Xanthomonadaceae bacterium]|jgi:multicomponent K+:H+ antiporter subunit D|nr:monovalent cation/H+ antiporter subunit D [Xanthomonadaceae bacterium]
MSHLPILLILIPLLASGLVLFAEQYRLGISAQRMVAWIALSAQVVAAILLFEKVHRGEIQVYLLGDWPARLGISLMVDRLSAWMVLTTALLAIACLLYACAGWDRRAPHFHSFFQLQLLGLNGAFLTGDLFNLFVFFEVLLAASYGLMLSGGRGERIRVGFHYVAFNVVASSLFLMALGMLYSLLGSLNMAELSVRVAQAPLENLRLIQAAAGLLLVVFCAKAALLPLYLWLPDTYASAPAPVAALFAIMTKLGLYAVLRVCTLLFGDAAGTLTGFAWPWLVVAGAATLILASIGVIASIRLRVMAAYLVLVSAGTLFIAFGLNDTATISAGLYYLAHSTFAGAALFLIADLADRRNRSADVESTESVANRIRAGVLFLIATIALAGLPPLSGFISKVLLLSAIPAAGQMLWLWGIILGSGFLALVGLLRIGVRLFWKPPEPGTHVLIRPSEIAAIVLLLCYGIGMTLGTAPVLRYTQAAAEQLLAPDTYLDQVRAVSPQRRSP